MERLWKSFYRLFFFLRFCFIIRLMMTRGEIYEEKFAGDYDDSDGAGRRGPGGLFYVENLIF